MISFFSTGYISRYILITILGIVIWLPSFLLSSEYNGVQSYAYDSISLILAKSTFLSTIISFVITLVSALLLNTYAIKYGVVGKVSTLIFALYIIFSSALVEDFHNNPVVWANLILIFVWGNMMDLPYTRKPIPVIFNASFLIGLASLFYTPLVFLFTFIWLSVIVHRMMSWRNLLVSIIGIILPYFFLMIISFSMGKLLEECYLLFNNLKIDFTPVLTSNPTEIIILVGLVIIIVVSAFGISGKLSERNINLRRNLLTTIVLLVLIYLILIVFTKTLVTLLLLCIPSVILVSNWVSFVKKPRFYNIALVSLTVIIILNQYISFIVKILES